MPQARNTHDRSDSLRRTTPVALPGVWAAPELRRHAPLRDITLETSVQNVSATAFIMSAGPAGEPDPGQR